jgi:hypothetical protein
VCVCGADGVAAAKTPKVTQPFIDSGRGVSAAVDDVSLDVEDGLGKPGTVTATVSTVLGPQCFASALPFPCSHLSSAHYANGCPYCSPLSRRRGDDVWCPCVRCACAEHCPRTTEPRLRAAAGRRGAGGCCPGMCICPVPSHTRVLFVEVTVLFVPPCRLRRTRTCCASTSTVTTSPCCGRFLTLSRLAPPSLWTGRFEPCFLSCGVSSSPWLTPNPDCFVHGCAVDTATPVAAVCPPPPAVSLGVPLPVRSVRQWWSGIVLTMVILCDSMGWMDLLTTACLGVASLLLLRTITVDEALVSTHPRILIMIAASFALGSALQNTGVATWVAKSLVDITTSSGRFGLLLGVSIATSLINALVSNNACMVLMFPVCVTVRHRHARNVVCACVGVGCEGGVVGGTVGHVVLVASPMLASLAQVYHGAIAADPAFRCWHLAGPQPGTRGVPEAAGVRDDDGWLH